MEHTKERNEVGFDIEKRARHLQGLRLHNIPTLRQKVEIYYGLSRVLSV